MPAEARTRKSDRLAFAGRCGPRGFLERRDWRHDIEKEEPIELDGTVEQVLGNGKFRVSVTETHSVLAQIAGKMRKYRIRVLPGDKVKVEVSPYDLEKGRITYRYRER